MRSNVCRFHQALKQGQVRRNNIGVLLQSGNSFLMLLVWLAGGFLGVTGLDY